MQQKLLGCNRKLCSLGPDSKLKPTRGVTETRPDTAAETKGDCNGHFQGESRAREQRPCILPRSELEVSMP